MAEKDTKAKGKDKGKKGASQGGATLFGMQVSKGPIKVLKWHIGVVLMVLGVASAPTYYFLQYTKQQQQLDALNNEIASMEDKLRNIENTRIEREKTQALIAEKEENIAYLERALPDFKFIPDFMVQIEQMATGFNLEVLSFTPTQKQAAPPPPAPAAPEGEAAGGAPAPAPAPGMPPPPGAAPGAAAAKSFNNQDEFAEDAVELQLGGGFNDLLLFTQELAVFPKVVVLDEIGFKVEVGESKNELVPSEKDAGIRAILLFKFFSRKEKAPAAPGAAPGPPGAPPATSASVTVSAKPAKGVRLASARKKGEGP